MLKLSARLYAAVEDLRDRQDGQTMAEYGVVLAVITVGVVLALSLLALAVAGKLGGTTQVVTEA